MGSKRSQFNSIVIGFSLQKARIFKFGAKHQTHVIGMLSLEAVFLPCF